ncbi:NaeI family type II restriction endonuclease [Nocardiopsis sp. YSL2]|uniref:NaeI family type II restriction endonuclease n=1 Tax=Nocardiopsis sp. YSL2 TaxID=2939492 RepID=UPI0026F45502|nr:NaeI family type II restriction endonuclease [Nocardiopsis sp. YSL2]
MYLFDPPLSDAANSSSDLELEQVAEHLLSLDPEGRLFADALRSTFDMLLDGQHTGRYRWDQLHKTEKTHFGTLVEINLQRKFNFAGGDELDYRIRDIDVDCKYSQKHGSWMIPPEAIGKLCLVLWASDTESRWSAGLVRASEELLGGGRNRDGKRSLNKQGRQAVRWLFSDAPLPVNALLHLPDGDVEAIFAPGSGTKRVDELFRRAQGILIRRVVVATVAQQEDYMKRVRGNGGSRSSLRPEGIVILGQYKGHGTIAEQLGLPVPGPGESVSARVVRASAHTGERAKALISGDWWVLATEADPVEPAPLLPKV